MTGTPLGSRDHRPPLPTSPGGRRSLTRQRRATMAGSSADAATLTATTQSLPDDGSIQIMPDSRIVTAAGEQIALTRMEFDLLVFLAEHPRRVFFRSQLLQSVWGYKVTGERTVDVHVRRLRVKLGDSFVTTVRGVGYRLADEARVRIVHLPHK